MRRILTLTAALVLVFCCIVTAGADVIFEPRDAFYETHKGECEYHRRSYTAQGPNGDVTVYESPESDKVITTIPNGESLQIYYIYQDASGNDWGFHENWDEEYSGWVPMAYLELIYDEISFREEFGQRLLEESGSLSGEYTGKTVKFWNYPGSTGYLDVYVASDYVPQYHMVYTDANGTRWGRVGYYMGIRDCWIDLGDPTADHSGPDSDAPAVTEAPTEPSVEASEAPVQEIVPQTQSVTGLVLLAAIAVIGVVGLTVVLLIVLKRRS